MNSRSCSTFQIKACRMHRFGIRFHFNRFLLISLIFANLETLGTTSFRQSKPQHKNNKNMGKNFKITFHNFGHFLVAR